MSKENIAGRNFGSFHRDAVQIAAAYAAIQGVSPDGIKDVYQMMMKAFYDELEKRLSNKDDHD